MTTAFKMTNKARFTLKSIRAKAWTEARITIETAREQGGNGHGYWLVGTQWVDGNYAKTLGELNDSVDAFIAEIEAEAEEANEEPTMGDWRRFADAIK